jgi:hypothetical protein
MVIERAKLDAVLLAYNLVCVVTFPATVGLNSHTANDSVFIVISAIGKYGIFSLINGLSDHDTQLLIISEVQKWEKECHTYIRRTIYKFTIADFELKLSHETWEPVFNRNDVNEIFNSSNLLF